MQNLTQKSRFFNGYERFWFKKVLNSRAM